METYAIKSSLCSLSSLTRTRTLFSNDSVSNYSVFRFLQIPTGNPFNPFGLFPMTPPEILQVFALQQVRWWQNRSHVLSTYKQPPLIGGGGGGHRLNSLATAQ